MCLPTCKEIMQEEYIYQKPIPKENANNDWC